MLSLEELLSKNGNELREIVKELPKEVGEYASALIGMMNPSKKKQKEIAKPKEEEEDNKKKGKSKGKGGKKGKNAIEEDDTVNVAETFIDVFRKVTDFGGPLFKSYDRMEREMSVICREAGKANDAYDEDGDLSTT